jgi:hypothetical protein
VRCAAAAGCWRLPPHAVRARYTVWYSTLGSRILFIEPLSNIEPLSGDSPPAAALIKIVSTQSASPFQRVWFSPPEQQQTQQTGFGRTRSSSSRQGGKGAAAAGREAGPSSSSCTPYRQKGAAAGESHSCAPRWSRHPVAGGGGRRRSPRTTGGCGVVRCVVRCPRAARSRWSSCCYPGHSYIILL